MAETEAKKEAVGARGGGGGSRLLLVLVALNTAVSGAGVALALVRRAPPAAAAADSRDGHVEAAGEKKRDEKAAAPGPTLKLPDFVVHLRDVEVDRFARISVEVEVADEKAREAVSARLPHIRDSFIAYLSDRTTADLRGSEAIARAKTDLSERLKQAAPGAPVRGLFITELVVQ